MQTEANDDGDLAGDRLVGVAAIAAFIDPNLSLWKAQRLLADGTYPAWKEGATYVASKRALKQRWLEMTSGFNAKPKAEDQDSGA